jgi:hypothetical protein
MAIDFIKLLDGQREMLGIKPRHFELRQNEKRLAVNHIDLHITFSQFINVNIKIPKEVIDCADNFQIVELGESVFQKTLIILEEQLSIPLAEVKRKKVSKSKLHSKNQSFYQFVANNSSTNSEIYKFINRYKNMSYLAVSEGALLEADYAIQAGDLIAYHYNFGLNLVGLDHIVKIEPDIKRIPEYDYIYIPVCSLDSFIIQKLYLENLIKKMYTPQIGLIPSLLPYIPWGCRARLFATKVEDAFYTSNVERMMQYLKINNQDLLKYFTPNVSSIFIFKKEYYNKIQTVLNHCGSGREIFQIIGEIVEGNRGPKVTIA